MAPWALALYALYLALAFGGRTLVQLRSTGFKGINGRPFSAEWSGGVLFVAAVLLGLAALVLDLAGTIEPVAVVDGSAGHALGFASSRASPGRSWRRRPWAPRGA
jgi:hypothetical protein